MSKKKKPTQEAYKVGRDGRPVSKKRWMIETIVLAVLAVSIVISFIVGVGAKKVKLPISGSDISSVEVYRVADGQATKYEFSDASLQTQMLRAVTGLIVYSGEQSEEETEATYVVRFTLSDGSDYVFASAKDASNYKDGEFVMQTDMESSFAAFCTEDYAEVTTVAVSDVPEGN